MLSDMIVAESVHGREDETNEEIFLSNLSGSTNSLLLFVAGFWLLLT